MLSEDRDFLNRLAAADKQCLDAAAHYFLPILQAVASRRLPKRFWRRDSPQDVAQIAVAEFVFCVRDGGCHFDGASDVKALLVKIVNSVVDEKIREHTAARRDIARESESEGDPSQDQTGHEPAGREADPFELIAAAEQWEWLLDGLSAVDREIIRLRAERYTFEEVGALVGRSSRQVKRVVARWRNRLDDLDERY